MIFKNELQLQKKIAELDFAFYETYPVSFTRREVRVGGCIPDLVSVHFVKDPDLFSWPQRWSYRHSFVVWLLRNKSLNLDEIASSFFEPVKRIKPVINSLIFNKIVTKTRDDRYELAKLIRDDFRANVIAVEAKLRDWRQALSQAKRYKDFANIVFVAMDATMVPLETAALEEFRSEQIGLCAVERKSVVWIINPENREEGIGHEKEYITMSPVIPSTQRFWSRRNRSKAVNQD